VSSLPREAKRLRGDSWPSGVEGHRTACREEGRRPPQRDASPAPGFLTRSLCSVVPASRIILIHAASDPPFVLHLSWIVTSLCIMRSPSRTLTRQPDKMPAMLCVFIFPSFANGVKRLLAGENEVGGCNRNGLVIADVERLCPTAAVARDLP
jgi:hypothetical protein